METKEFEEKLLKEKQELDTTLSSTSTKNPKNQNDWEATYPDLNVDPSDKSDMADEVEGFDTNLGINNVLEERYREITAALGRIKDGTYGTCTVGGEAIELDRLQANPSARTCTKHA